MPGNKISPHPAFSSNRQRVLLRYTCALLIICGNTNAICRREIWGRTAKHVYAETIPGEGERLMIVNEAGCLAYYIPSIDDLTANDWVAG